MRNRRLVLALFLVVALSAALQAGSEFVCGHKEHDPPHVASTVDKAKSLSRKYGCHGWFVALPDRGNSMPVPNLQYLLIRQAEAAAQSEAEGLNKYLTESQSRVTYRQVRPDNLDEQPFGIAIAKVRVDDRVRFTVRLSSKDAAPPRHGYLATLMGSIAEPFRSVMAETRFDELKPETDGDTLTFTFEQPTTSAPHPDWPWDQRFSLADSPIDTEESTAKTVYWFSLKDFSK